MHGRMYIFNMTKLRTYFWGEHYIRTHDRLEGTELLHLAVVYGVHLCKSALCPYEHAVELG
jgi:hypothetical protein